MDYNEFLDIINNNNVYIITLCNIQKGLDIKTKYIRRLPLFGLGKRIVKACKVKDLIDAGITKEDVEKLAALGWTVDKDGVLVHVRS